MISEPPTTNSVSSMRHAGARLAQVLASIQSKAAEGVCLQRLDELVREELDEAGMEPANLEVMGFAHATSFGLNTVVSGIQVLDVTLAKGDLLTLDVAARDHSGVVVDAARSFGIGTRLSLCKMAEMVTYAAIAAIVPGATPEHVLEAILNALPEAGPVLAPLPFLHGLGPRVHEEPCATPDQAGKHCFQPGEMLAVEPVLMERKSRLCWDVSGWEVSAANECLTAFVEHSVLVTSTGSEILTEAPRSA